ncbi:hypothetical protein L3V83_13755 [Thiotrichales bacterium 19X7-9]|nr:hypothetical protein [Thiotrichales bacterium 19X7-9]
MYKKILAYSLTHISMMLIIIGYISVIFYINYNNSYSYIRTICSLLLLALAGFIINAITDETKAVLNKKLHIIISYLYMFIISVFFLAFIPLSVKNYIVINYFSTSQPYLFSKTHKIPNTINSITCNGKYCIVDSNKLPQYTYQLQLSSIPSPSCSEPLGNCINSTTSTPYILDNNYVFQITKNDLKVFPSIDKDVNSYKYIRSLNRVVELINKDYEARQLIANSWK